MDRAGQTWTYHDHDGYALDAYLIVETLEPSASSGWELVHRGVSLIDGEHLPIHEGALQEAPLLEHPCWRRLA